MKFRSSNYKDVFDQLYALKEEAIKMIDIDDDTLEYLIYKNKLQDNDSFDILNRLRESVDFRNLFIFKVVLFPTNEGVIYGYHICGNNNYIKLLDGLYDEFEYWNHTDKPEDIDYTDWDWRGLKWDELLKTHYIEDSGMVVNIVSINDIDPHIIRKQIRSLLEIMKRDKKISDLGI